MPVLEQLVGRVTGLDGVPNVLIAHNHFLKLHGQVILVLDCSTHSHRRPDTDRRRRDVRDQQIKWLAETCLHVE